MLTLIIYTSLIVGTFIFTVGIYLGLLKVVKLI